MKKFCLDKNHICIKRRGKSLALILAVLVILSGCAFPGIDSQTLMSPPKANSDQQSVYRLLQGNRQGIKFVFPKAGENRSAIISKSFTGNGDADAVGFYAVEDGGVEVKFLTKINGEWKIISTFKNTVTQVDRIHFRDLNGDGVNEVIIGWGSTQSLTATACVYEYNGESMNEYPLGVIYGDMAITDFNEDGIYEVFTAEIYTPTQSEEEDAAPAKAKVFALSDEGMTLRYEVNVDNSVVRYTNTIFGKIDEGVPGLVIDGAKADNSLVTQVFFINDMGGFEIFPSLVDTDQESNPFYRPQAATFSSRDIDADGLIEMPEVRQLPKISEDAVIDSTSFLVKWSRLDLGKTPRTVLSTLMNTSEGYWFELLPYMYSSVASSNDAVVKTVTYTEVVEMQGDVPILGSVIFRIRVFKSSVWDERGKTSGYEEIARHAEMVYGIQVVTSDLTYQAAIDRVKESFTVITD